MGLARLELATHGLGIHWPIHIDKYIERREPASCMEPHFFILCRLHDNMLKSFHAEGHRTGFWVAIYAAHSPEDPGARGLFRNTAV